MATVLDSPATTDNHPANSESDMNAQTEFGHKLQLDCAAVRVRNYKMGVKKSLSKSQHEQAAVVFGADDDVLVAAKKLIDTKHKDFKAVTSIRGNVIAYWKSITLPFPERATRLIRRDRIEHFEAQMKIFKKDLKAAVVKLNSSYQELKDKAKKSLGDLYNEADYPPTLIGEFNFEWDYPSVEPPNYLKELSPKLYEQEKLKIANRFEDAVQMAEQAFVHELSEMMSHLSERLTPSPDGKKKIFRDSALDNVSKFFERFKQLNINSNTQLDELVDDAQKLVSGVEVKDLREKTNLQKKIRERTAEIKEKLDSLMVDRPKRKFSID